MAQPPGPYEAAERALVRKLLNSTDYQDLAWGAHLAGKYEDRSVRDELIRVMATPNEDVQLQALDSLIRLNFGIEREHLERWYLDYPVQTLILSARMVSGRRNQAEFYESVLGKAGGTILYIATVNLLAEIDQQRAVMVMLPLLEPKADISIVDPNVAVFGVGGGVAGSRLGGAVYQLPGLPPRRYYSLYVSRPDESWQPSGADPVALANGPSQVLYRRTEYPTSGFVLDSEEQYRFSMIAWLLKRSGNSQPAPLQMFTHMSATQDKLADVVAEAKLKLAQDYRELVRALVSRSLLPEGFSAPVLKATIAIHDRRAGADQAQSSQVETFELVSLQ